MQQRYSFLQTIVVCLAVVFCNFLGCEGKPETAQEGQMLKITVGEPTTPSSVEYSNSASLCVSRTRSEQS